MIDQIDEQAAAAALLHWYSQMGVDEAVAATPANFYSWRHSPPPKNTEPARRPERAKAAVLDSKPDAVPADEAVETARQIAAACDTLKALEQAVAAFDGCPLKEGARNSVFADGAPDADLLVVGEAPGRDEDRMGKPFVGRAGQLLDAMLAAIDRSRKTNVLITNVIYWRPPGNRTPTQTEVAICKPFIDRLIELTAPKAILLVGGAPLQALLGVTGIMRARGIWREVETAGGRRIPVLPTFHPAFLLRQPANKRLAWSDLQSLQTRLREG